MNKLDHTTLREYLNYDPETGVFTWRKKPNRNVVIGSVAGSLNRGYMFISIAGVRFAAHRLAWLYVHGVWPVYNIDHINGIPSDNRISNLRDVPQQINVQNIRRARSKSTYMGVFRERYGRWGAKIQHNYKQIRVGTFDTPEEAHTAYLEAKRKLHAGCTL